MKKLALALTMIVSLGASAAPAFARSIMPPVLRSELTRFELDPELVDNARVVGGDVRINTVKRQITLTLYRKSSCPRNAFCVASIPAPLIVELPLVSSRADDCGNVVFQARQDRRLVDGALQSLIVTDHTNNRCPTFQALPDTSVVYETTSFRLVGDVGREVQTHSTFEGTALVPTSPVVAQ